jgi:hypothetical protein
MTADDVVRTLCELDCVFKSTEYKMRVDRKSYRQELERLEQKGYIKVRPECLQWTPCLFKRFSIKE